MRHCLEKKKRVQRKADNEVCCTLCGADLGRVPGPAQSVQIPTCELPEFRGKKDGSLFPRKSHKAWCRKDRALCLSYFSTVVTKHHDQDNVQKKTFNLRLMVPKGSRESITIMAGSVAAGRQT